MITILPVAKALVPLDSVAASAIMAPNYDEFQSDEEVWQIIQEQPNSILRTTMAHCDVDAVADIGEDGSHDALNKAGQNLQELTEGPLTHVVEGLLWVYEIDDPTRGGVRQLGLGGSALTQEIRTDETPDGTVIRNEGIREEKARGRANLISATRSYVGIVNNAVEDKSGAFVAALEHHADNHDCCYQADDEFGNTHRVWLVTKPAEIEAFQKLLAAEPFAYVADGNHRSAAAALLGRKEYLSVFFPTSRLGLAPYNRLVNSSQAASIDWQEKLATHFAVTPAPTTPYQPADTHNIGLYVGGKWWNLQPKPTAFDAGNAAESIDSDIVQRRLFDEILGISDPKDKQLTFVGGNKDAAWLQKQVDDGRFEIAITLPPVTMTQFVDVCRQNRFMPPKSTWFQPKIRSGLVVSLWCD